MKVAMPIGNTHGWGIAGTYLTNEIARLPTVPGVTLHCVAGHHFAPGDESQWDKHNIGYCFFEHEILAYRFIPDAARRWDHIVAGSSWCEHHLRIAGMERSSTILQGIDPLVFQPMPQRTNDGRFIVFSGGKFEFRKGHDLVMAAMRIFMARHNDVWLACAWHNHWPQSIKTMEQSRLIQFRYQELPCDQFYPGLLAENGIDPERVILYPVMENQLMRSAYADSDIGLFPNRCEGGNNMVMCEYMACGRPVIASTMTGHRDVVDLSHAMCLTSYIPVLARIGDDVTGVWFEPSVDEIISLLESAYCDRMNLKRIGIEAGKAMTKLSWESAALKFHDIALQLTRSASDAQKISIQCSEETARDFFEAGRFAEAELCFRTLLKRSPLDPFLHNSIATTLDRMGRYPEALLHYGKAIAISPDFNIARFNMANSLKRAGNPLDAIKQLELVITSDAAFLEAWQNLALCHYDNGNLRGAADCLKKATLIDSECIKNLTDLGDILIEVGDFEDAVIYLNRVLEKDPGQPGALNSKGTALQELDDLDGAEACYRKILESDPDNVLALNNLATVLRSRALPLESLIYFNKALLNAPGDGQILFNRSLALLTLGEFKQGWDEYEKRFEREVPVSLSHSDLPKWDGNDLGGRRLLVQSEQGYGDTFQFARYLPLLAKKYGHVVFEVQDYSIKSALNCFAGVSVFARGEQLPDVDCQIPLLSLPRIFGTDFTNIPFPEGYILANPECSKLWESRLQSPEGIIRVGLVWGGRKTRLNSNRSLLLSELKPLLAIKGIHFISLQLGADAVQLSEFPGTIHDFSDQIFTFSDTAAIIDNLDLVITIDSAVAHLSGAMGEKTWVLLKFAPDWRWFLGRNDSPWYANTKLFRQKSTGDWRSVILEVAKELTILHKRPKSPKV